MKNSLLCAVLVVFLSALPARAADIATMDGDAYMAMDRSQKLLFIEGILFGAKLHASFIKKYYLYSIEVFKLMAKGYTKKEDIAATEQSIHCDNICMEKSEIIGVIELNKDVIFDFVEKFYANKENRKIKLRDAITLSHLEHDKARPIELEHYEAYLRAGKTPEAWEKYRLIEEPGRNPYGLNPILFQ